MMSVAEPELRRWTTDEYLQAADLGVFGPEERLELVNGEIYRMSPQNGPHATACDLLAEALRAAFGGGYLIRGQKPLLLGGSSVPEPDVYVVRGRIRDFARQHPTSAELVVEVSDATVRFDMGTKSALYASAGIQDYWVVVIPERVLVVHRDPDPAAGIYRSIVRLRATDHVLPLAAPDSTIPVEELLP